MIGEGNCTVCGWIMGDYDLMSHCVHKELLSDLGCSRMGWVLS